MFLWLCRVEPRGVPGQVQLRSGVSCGDAECVCVTTPGCKSAFMLQPPPASGPHCSRPSPSLPPTQVVRGDCSREGAHVSEWCTTPCTDSHHHRLPPPPLPQPAPPGQPSACPRGMLSLCIIPTPPTHQNAASQFVCSRPPSVVPHATPSPSPSLPPARMLQHGHRCTVLPFTSPTAKSLPTEPQPTAGDLAWCS